MRRYGVFISHRHEDWALAGRVYDYLEVRGFQPFLDADSMRQGNFHDALGKVVTQTPLSVPSELGRSLSAAHGGTAGGVR